MWIVSAGCVSLLSAYVACTIVDSTRAIGWVFLLAATVLSGGDYLRILWPLRPTDAWKTTGLVQHVAGLAVASVARDLTAYCVAFVFSFFFVALVVLAHERSLVRYHPGVGFGVSSAVLYASLRVLGRVLVREADAWTCVAHLLPFLASTLETLAMYASRSNRFYSFVSASPEFALYSVLKASIFLLLPRLEDLLRERV